jgi:hypothetical protein
MESKKFITISIRARLAYTVCCLENALAYFKLKDTEWLFVLTHLWSYTNSNVGRWHEQTAEITGRSIINDENSLDDLAFLSKDQFWKINAIYKKANKDVLRIIDLIFEIGTRDLYASIVNGSPDTLNYLQKIIDLMKQNNIPLPDYDLFKNYSISENEGWGREFTRDEIFIN